MRTAGAVFADWEVVFVVEHLIGRDVSVDEVLHRDVVDGREGEVLLRAGPRVGYGGLFLLVQV